MVPSRVGFGTDGEAKALLSIAVLLITPTSRLILQRILLYKREGGGGGEYASVCLSVCV